MKTTYSNPRKPGLQLHFERRGADLAVAVDDTINESMKVIQIPGEDIPGAVESLMCAVAAERPVEEHHRGYMAHLPWGAVVDISTSETDPEVLRKEALKHVEQAFALMASAAHVERGGARLAKACEDIRREFPDYDSLVDAMARLREQAPTRKSQHA